jgi:hypothetical protein
MARLTKFDTEALRYVRNLPRSRVDRALRWVSGVANYNVPWLERLRCWLCVRPVVGVLRCADWSLWPVPVHWPSP